MAKYLILLLCLSLAGCLAGSAFAVKEDFCGRSTNGVCYSNADCIAAGCDTQLCHSRFDETLPVVCDGRECYNAKAYGLTCKCVESKCQWTKKK